MLNGAQHSRMNGASGDPAAVRSLADSDCHVHGRKSKRRPLSPITKERIRTGMKNILLRHTRGIYCNDGGLRHFSSALDSTLERYLSARYGRILFNDERGHEDQFDNVSEFSNLQPPKRREICRDIDELLKNLRLDDNIHPDIDDAVCEEINHLNQQAMERSERTLASLKRFLRDRENPPLENGEAEPDSAQASGQQQQSSTDPLAGFIFDGDAKLEPPPMLIKKLVPLDGICFIGGQSGAGKTFVAIDLGVSLASGETFFGHRVVERVGVAIFAAEGASTIASRVTVARNHKAQGEILPITWLGAVPNLADVREVKTMVQRLRAVDARFRSTHGVRLGAAIYDTLAASFSLNDENDNSEAAKAIRAMKIMSDALGVVILPVHHFGKAAETGLRGASAWRAGCDTVLSVLADRDQTTGACSNRRIALTKSRVGEEGWVAPFDLHFVALGVDEDGEKFGACYVEPGRLDDTIIVAGVKEKRVPRAAKVYLDALSLVIGDKGRKVRPFGSEDPEVVAVDRENIRDEFDPSWPADSDTPEKRKEARRKAFDRGEEWALNNKRIATREVSGHQMVWLLKEVPQ